MDESAVTVRFFFVGFDDGFELFEDKGKVSLWGHGSLRFCGVE